MTAEPKSSSPAGEPLPEQEGMWTVGTLTYTFGGLALLFFWLLWGDFAWSMRDRAIPAVMQLLFRKYSTSDLLVGLMYGSLPVIIGLVTGPFICYSSDRHRGRWGRRIPYLVVTTPIVVLSLIGLAFAPQLGELVHPAVGSLLSLNRTILVFLALFWGLFEFSAGVSNMIFGALVNDVVPHRRVGRFYGLFRAVSLIAGMIFNWTLMGKAETYYIEIFLGIAVLFGVGFTFLCTMVKEGDYPDPPPATKDGGWLKKFLAAVALYFKEGYGKSYYLWYFASSILLSIMGAPMNLYYVFFAKSLHVSLDLYGKTITASYFVSLCLAYPLGWLADRFHPMSLTLISMLVFWLVLLGGAFFVNDTNSFVVVLFLYTVLGGCVLTLSASLPMRLLPRDKFAMMSSAGGTLGCIAWIVLPPLLGTFLDHIGHAYRYTFHISAVLVALALITNYVVYRKFIKLGGPDHYVAP